jgi:hypothetical protein
VDLVRPPLPDLLVQLQFGFTSGCSPCSRPWTTRARYRDVQGLLVSFDNYAGSRWTGVGEEGGSERATCRRLRPLPTGPRDRSRHQERESLRFLINYDPAYEAFQPAGQGSRWPSQLQQPRRSSQSVAGSAHGQRARVETGVTNELVIKLRECARPRVRDGRPALIFDRRHGRRS